MKPRLSRDVNTNDMKLHHLLLTLFLLVSQPSYGNEFDLPAIITYVQTESGDHSYSLPVAYENIDKETLNYIRGDIPDLVRIAHLNTTDGFTFVTNRRLRTTELSAVFNGLAGGWCLLPNWAEIQFLSMPKGASFSDENFKTFSLDEKSMEGFFKKTGLDLEHFEPIRRQCWAYSRLFLYDSSTVMTINSKASLCMGHDRYSLRLFNVHGQIVWEYSDALSGDIRVLMRDTDEDDKMEILIHLDNHGRKSLVIIEEN